jgi:predicted DCC family thiol-disulfide oxidoreductase YuxK
VISVESGAALVLYDEDCRLCRAAAGMLERRGVTVAGIGSGSGETWLRDLDARARYAEFHAVDRVGRRFSGGDAVPLVLEALPHGRLPAAIARRLPRLTTFGYELVSRNRSTLSHLVGLR